MSDVAFEEPTLYIAELETKNRKLSDKVMASEASRKVLADAVKKEKKRSKLYLKVAVIAGFPVLIIAVPLIFVFYLLPKYLPKYLKARNVFDIRKKRVKPTVYDAFMAYHLDGIEAARAVLSSDPQGIPAGVNDLFDAMDAQSDAEWQVAINRWCAANGFGGLHLIKGDAARFPRIRFDPMPSVDAPHLVTIIMPCFNASKTVEMAIRSILNQTWQNIELIAVNDASSDDTGAILDGLTQSDARLRVYHNTVNVGPYVSKNRALRLAKGAYITGHDADDIALPDRIARQMAPILADPKCRASIGYMMGVNGTGSFVRPSKPNLADKYTLDGVLRLASIALLIERSFLYQHLGYWDCVKVSADTELLERLMAVQPNVLTLVKSCTMICLVHEQSLTQNVHSGLSNFEGHSQTRKEYKVAFRAWHSASRPDQRRLDFPPQPRAFKAPEKMVVPIDDILTVIDQDRPPIQA